MAPTSAASALIQQLRDAVISRADATAVFGNGDEDLKCVSIVSPKDCTAFPYGKLQPMRDEWVTHLRTAVMAEDRVLHYEPKFRRACFPQRDDPFDTKRGSGIISAAWFARAHLFLSSHWEDLASSEQELRKGFGSVARHMRLDDIYGADRRLDRGTVLSSDDRPAASQQWRGFGWVDKGRIEGCVIGTDASTKDSRTFSTALLGSEVAALSIVLSSQRNLLPRIAALISITNTHARFIQASIVDEGKEYRLVVSILVNEPLMPNGQMTWDLILRWAFFSCNKSDRQNAIDN